jgi:TPP-dependent pyruvate/acetoin dehydrogenase alpha subunit
MRAEKDCIARVKSLLLKQEWATEAELKAVDKKNRAMYEEILRSSRD